MPTKPLTPKQEITLRALRAYRKQNGYSPTITELCALLGMRSINATYSRLILMERGGWLVRDPNLSSREFLPASEHANPRTTTKPGAKSGDTNS